MFELDPKLLHRFDRIVVDSKQGCLVESGEIIAAVEERPLTLHELGEEWVHGRLEDYATGDVFYKSVGTAAMDLAVGWEIVKLARDRTGVGFEVEQF